MLRLVEPDLWDKQEGESEDEFALFCIWLMRRPRTAPCDDDRELAARNSWAHRATAYDNFIARPKLPEDQLAETRDALLRGLNLEAVKFLQESQRTRGRVLNAREMVAIYQILQDAVVTSENEVDLSLIPEDELNSMLGALHRAKRA